MTLRIWLRIIAWIFIISGFFYIRATRAGNEVQSKKNQQKVQVIKAFNDCIATQLQVVDMLENQYFQREVYLGILSFCKKNTGYEGK